MANRQYCVKAWFKLRENIEHLMNNSRESEVDEFVIYLAHIDKLVTHRVTMSLSSDSVYSQQH